MTNNTPIDNPDDSIDKKVVDIISQLLVDIFDEVGDEFAPKKEGGSPERKKLLGLIGKVQPYREEAESQLKQLLLSKLPEKIEEGDGWDIYFTNGKEKGKVRSCCPGDDIAYVQNKTVKEVEQIINKLFGEKK